MKTLTDRDIAERARNWQPHRQAAARSLVALARGSGEAPLRASLSLEDGVLLSMPGRIRGEDIAIVKLVTVVSANVGRGLPTIQGLALVFDARTGQPIASLDGSTLTGVRTAAISAAAAQVLATPQASRMALLGAGAQAPWQARAITALFPIRELTTWSPTAAHREELAGQLAGELSARVRAVASAEDATRGAQIVVAATTAREAFIHQEMLSPGALVIAIGAFQRGMAEVGNDVLREAGRVYVDDVEAVRHEGGDVIAAIEEGAIAPEAVLPVGDVIAGQPAVRGKVTVFKSVGSAVEDAAVAEALLEPG